MTVKELKDLLALLRDDDEMMAYDSRMLLCSAGHLIQAAGSIEVKPGIGPEEAPRKFYLAPKRGE